MQRHTGYRRTVQMATARSFSSASRVKLTGVELTSEEGRDKCHTTRLPCQECSVVVRRGTSLLLHLTLSSTISTSYTITLTFIPVHGPRERSSVFKALGRGKDISDLWLKISLPANFPIGKYDTHLLLSLQSSLELLSHTVHSAVTILFNPWHQDDDTYMHDESALHDHLISDIGVIWRGTVTSPAPHLWDYGQFSDHCLDVALFLLRDMCAESRRSAAAVCRTIVTRLSPADGSGVLISACNGRYGAGTHPCRWNGSAAIMQRFYRTRSPVRYAHCWVLAGAAVTLLRALGIPCRTVTCYVAAPHSKQLGKVKCYFSPDGDILSDLQTDQLWPYHVWCEAWMRRDDLLADYDGWQAFCCGWGVSTPGSGPAPVRAIREKKQGKLWQYDVVKFLSELHSEMRYLRVTHSYSSYSQRAVSLAHTDCSATGRLVLAGSSGDKCLDITSTYKEERTTDETMTPKSRDCHFSVECEGNKLGTDPTLTITITNRGPMLRTVDGKVVGGVCRHSGQISTKFMGVEYSGAITPEQTATVRIPVQCRQFLKHLVEENMLEFFIVAKVRETQQMYLSITHHQMTPPTLILSCQSSVRVGETVTLRISFTNPLPSTITHTLFTVQAQQLCTHKEIAYRKLVLPGRSIVVQVSLAAEAVGSYTILCNMHSDQLTDVRGSTQLHVTP